ncbi:MAG: hypothetical protein N5P05_003423 [Chroococcopsis gigantea SAG 12.99]|jgi:hypothetical protein|nr:acetyltransferase [Chlorogloea purpurea SAG 13.99]MDV3001817.1 hypothetical protein [Chroococcopsis gigantea SAG 12.99]
MLLQDKETGTLVEIEDIIALINPSQGEITGQIQAGQEEQPPESFSKQSLKFPSGEDLPLCWLDADYRLK